MTCNNCGSRTPRNALCKQCSIIETHTPDRDADADMTASEPNEYRCSVCETEYLDDGSDGCPDCGSKRRRYIGELAIDGGEPADDAAREYRVPMVGIGGDQGVGWDETVTATSPLEAQRKALEQTDRECAVSSTWLQKHDLLGGSE